MSRAHRSRRSTHQANRTRQSCPDPVTLDGKDFEIDSGTARIERHTSRTLTLYINDAPSSFIDLEDPTNVGFEYLEIMSVIIDSLPDGPLAVTHLGAAGCTLARSIDHTRKHSTQIAVDRDAALLDLARKLFSLPRSPALRLRAGDARNVLEVMRTDSADVIVRDVFAPDVTPYHLTTTEFLTQVKRVLKPGGLYLANIADRPPLALTRHEAATARHTFEDQAHIGIVTEPAILNSRRYGNVVLAATMPPAHNSTWTSDTTMRRLRTLPVPMRAIIGPNLDDFARQGTVLYDKPEED